MKETSKQTGTSIIQEENRMLQIILQDNILRLYFKKSK